MEQDESVLRNSRMNQNRHGPVTKWMVLCHRASLMGWRHPPEQRSCRQRLQQCKLQLCVAGNTLIAVWRRPSRGTGGTVIKKRREIRSQKWWERIVYKLKTLCRTATATSPWAVLVVPVLACLLFPPACASSWTACAKSAKQVAVSDSVNSVYNTERNAGNVPNAQSCQAES